MSANLYPASWEQIGLWLFMQRVPDSRAYNEGVAVHIRGPLDRERLERSLAAIYGRHGVLRSTFRIEGEQLVQETLPHESWPRMEIAREPLSPRDFIRRPFSLADGPLVRTMLVERDREEHVLFIALHHIVADHGSLGIFLEELAALYTGSTLPEPPAQYADYVRRQRERMAAVVDAPAPPRDERIEDGDATARSFVVPEQTARAVRALARAHKSTAFSALLAAFAVLQAGTGSAEVAIGTDVANRDLLAFERVIGLFAAQTSLRVDLSGNPTFEEILARAKAATIDVLARRALQRVRITAKFVLQTALPSPVIPGLVLEAAPVSSGAAKFDVLLNMWDDAGGMRGTFELARHDADRAVARFQRILASVTADPRARLADLLEPSRPMQRGANLERLRAIQARGRRERDGASILVTPLSSTGGRVVEIAPPQRSDVARWVMDNGPAIAPLIENYGAVLLRNCHCANAAALGDVLRSILGELVDYREQSSPRTSLGGQIYTSTEYPSRLGIPLHSENSYAHTWPLRIAFYCERVAERGGRTPLADCRRLLRRIPASIRTRFAEKGVLYVRNFGTGVGHSWQTAFQVTDRSELERQLCESEYEFQWLDEGARLRTKRRAPAIVRHPSTGELSWFNHAVFFHESGLDADLRAGLRLSANGDLPWSTHYGDGTPIESEVIAELRKSYGEETVSFAWQVGDLLLLDNMLVAHGREAFTGPRRILASMAMPTRLSATMAVAAEEVAVV